MGQRKIGVVARELLISERRIREYERLGLIRPRREQTTGDRLFDDQDVAQLRLIKSLVRERRYPLRAVQDLIRCAPCWELTGCTVRESCPAFHNLSVPCYEQRAAGAVVPRGAECERCLVYLGKDSARAPVTLSPTRGVFPAAGGQRANVRTPARPDAPAPQHHSNKELNVGRAQRR